MNARRSSGIGEVGISRLEHYSGVRQQRNPANSASQVALNMQLSLVAAPAQL